MKENVNIDILIAKYLANDMSFDEENRLKNWIDISNENQLYFTQTVSISHAIEQPFAVSSIDVDLAEKKLMSRIIGKKWHEMSFVVWTQRIAAILFIPLFLLLAYQSYEYNKKPTENLYNEVIASVGMRAKVNLPDGSIVWLNSGTKLKYPTDLDRGNRVVHLSGEAYFEVHSDVEHPFVVSTATTDIIATGTAFNVDAYSSDSLVTVVLASGKVYVSSLNSQKIKLEPNQKVIYNINQYTNTVVADDASKRSAWKDGKMIFRDDRLDYVLKKIGQVYNVAINIKNEEIAAQPYRATFEGETLDEILELLKLSTTIRYEKVNRIQMENGKYSQSEIIIH